MNCVAALNTHGIECCALGWGRASGQLWRGKVIRWWWGSKILSKYCCVCSFCQKPSRSCSQCRHTSWDLSVMSQTGCRFSEAQLSFRLSLFLQSLTVFLFSLCLSEIISDLENEKWHKVIINKPGPSSWRQLYPVCGFGGKRWDFVADFLFFPCFQFVSFSLFRSCILQD